MLFQWTDNKILPHHDEDDDNQNIDDDHHEDPNEDKEPLFIEDHDDPDDNDDDDNDNDDDDPDDHDIGLNPIEDDVNVENDHPDDQQSDDCGDNHNHHEHDHDNHNNHDEWSWQWWWWLLSKSNPLLHPNKSTQIYPPRIVIARIVFVKSLFRFLTKLMKEIILLHYYHTSNLFWPKSCHFKFKKLWKTDWPPPLWANRPCN